MADLLARLADVARLAQSAPNAARLLDAARRATQGDQTAVAYLRDVGVYDAADLLQPGAGPALRDALRHTAAGITGVREAIAGRYAAGQVVDGEYRVLSDEPAPWERFTRWLARRTWGAWVVLGPKGTGKTTFALRLAEVWHQRTGYPVEGVNLYHDDRPDFADGISLAVLRHRMERLARYLEFPSDRLEDADEDLDGDGRDGGADEPDAPTPRQLAIAHSAYSAMLGRVVIIDETSLAMGSGSTDTGRRLARQAMAQARHLRWLVIYVGQLAKHMPSDLLACEAVFVKRPGGWEAEVDRQEPLVQRLWSDAAEAFGQVRPDWRRAYPDARSWAFVDCRSPYYRGLMPFLPPGSDRGEATEGGDER